MKYIILNCLLSIVIFALAFYSYAGVSGGDIAIMAMNVIAGILQMFAVSIYMHFAKRGSASNIVLALIAMQVAELVLFINFGYDINIWIKGIKH